MYAYKHTFIHLQEQEHQRTHGVAFGSTKKDRFGMPLPVINADGTLNYSLKSLAHITHAIVGGKMVKDLKVKKKKHWKESAAAKQLAQRRSSLLDEREELLRRLATGDLTPEEEAAIRARLAEIAGAVSLLSPLSASPP